MTDPANKPPPNNAGRRQVDTIDFTPKWRSILPMLLVTLRDGTPEGQRMATEELERMADAADAHLKATK
jgi:hypothetical protein